MELKDTLVNYWKDRTSTPWLGCMIISWCAFNWEILYITLFTDSSKLKAYDKLDYITNNLLDVCSNLVWPIVIGTLLTFAYPWLNNQVFKYTEKKAIQRQNSKKSISGIELMTKTEAILIREQHAELANLNQDLTAQNLTIKADFKKKMEEYEALGKESEKVLLTDGEKHLKIVNQQNNLNIFRTEFVQYALEKGTSNPKPAGFLSGRWKNSWGGTGDTEYCEIRNGTIYYLGGVHAFDLQGLSFDPTTKLFRFTKKGVRSGDNRELYNELTLSSSSVLTGFEKNLESNEQYKIEYTRAD